MAVLSVRKYGDPVLRRRAKPVEAVTPEIRRTIADMIDTMFLAAEIYGDDRCRAAAEKGGDFILLAQMPEPQPAWAQQYNADMHPAWARRFEPASITGGESQGAIRILLRIYRETGKEKYLEPIPRAIASMSRPAMPP